MSYQTERSAIEAYLIAAWAGATPVIPDGQSGAAVANSISITIQNGAALQGSIGGTTNRIDYVGLLQIMIYTEAGKGSAAWRGYAETLKTIFLNKRITAAGALIASVDEEFIRFSPQGQHPYIAGTQTDAGMMTTTLNVPFTRFETE